MTTLWRFAKQNAFPLFFFLCISLFLWLGDGLQSNIEYIAAISVLIISIVISRITKKQRHMDPVQASIGLIFFLYIIVRTIFSDDVGFSLSLLVRYLTAATIYDLFYCYISRQSISIVLHSIFGWSLFAIASSLFIMLVPRLNYFQGMNLLTTQYAHHLMIIPILFSFAPCVYLWIKTKKWYYFLLAAIFLVASILSFSRAALIAETFVVLGILLWQYGHNRRIRLLELGIGIIITLGLITIFTLPYATIYKNSVLSNMTIKMQNPFVDRINYWTQAITAIREQPLFGYGPGTFLVQSFRLQPYVLGYVSYSHNSILEQLVDLGFIGVIPILVLFFVIGSTVRKKLLTMPEKQKYPILTLLLSLAPVLIFSLGDFPLNFFMPLLLFWAILGSISGISAKNTKKESLCTVWISRGRISLLILSLCIILGDQFLTNTWKVFPCEHIRGMVLQFCLMRNTNGKIPITDSDFQTYEILHKNNSSVLYTIGYKQKMLGKNQEAKRVLHHAVLYNPFFQYGYYDYLEILAQEKNYEDLGYSIELLSCKTFSGPLCERIKGFHLSSPLYKEAYQSVFEKMTGGITFYQDYAVLFYRIGKYFLDKKPEVTEQFWTFIRDAHPGWGPFHSELASFYEYTLKDHTKAVAVLEACQINKAAASECKLRLTKGLSPPGSLESVIIWNWDF